MRHPFPVPARQLAPLAVGVLAVHLVLLQWRSDSFIVPQLSLSPPAFLTRQVPAQPAAPASLVPQAPAPTAQPAPPAPPAAETAAPPQPQPRPALSEHEQAPQPAPPPPAAPRVLLEPNAPSIAAPPAPGSSWRATALPEPARMNYEVIVEAKGFKVEGHAQLQWRHDGRSYEARLEVGGPLLPSRVQKSNGRITADGLEPLRFSDQGSRGEQATHFQRDRGRLVFSNNQPEAALEAGAQDRLSIVVQLSVIIAGEPQKYPPGTAIAIPTAGLRDSETWVFTVQGEEDLALPGGTLRTLKLQREPRKEHDQKVELWLAPGKDYAPVRLRLTNPNGDSVDQRWVSTDKG
jgi:hypothetical protein